MRASPTTWEKYYGLRARAFSLTPDLRFVFHSASHTRAFEEVTSALRRREGLIVVTGEVGTGKTMLCRALLETFETRIFQSVILDPMLTVEDLLYQVLADFGLISDAKGKRHEPFSDIARHHLVSTLQRFLASLIPLEAHAVIMIDEAQHLGPQVLEEIRLLSNFETDQEKLLQIVLVGQPNLEELLSRPDMRQLNQRVARRCELHPLTPPEVRAYVEHRLQVAAEPQPGDEELEVEPQEPISFTPEALEAVATISQGTPRTVNTLCDRALESAFEAKRRPIDLDAVLDGAAHLKLPIPETEQQEAATRNSVWKLYAAAAVLAAAAVAGTWMYMRMPDPATAQKPEVSSTRPAAPAAAPAPAPAVTTEPAAPPTAAPPDASSNAPSAATPPPVSAPASTTPAATPAPAAGYQVVLASFRTKERAALAADQVKLLGQPGAVRFDAPSGWYIVYAGPYPTTDAAQKAQLELQQQGFSGTRIITP